MKWNKKKICILVAVAALLLVANICRLIGNCGIYKKQAGLIRSFLYIVLFATWGLSAYSRIIQPVTRRYLSEIAFLMVFWFVIRSLKFHIVSSELYPNITRYLWYLYYLAILFIPLLAVFVAISIGKSENYRLSKKATLLYIPTTVLFLLVITNDLHQLVFTFPKDAVVWTDDKYGYTVVYYFLILWLFFCALTMFTVMYKKRRVSGTKRMILLPCIPLVALVFYLILYFFRIEWLQVIAGDMTAVMRLMYAATLEICIQCGFIQANTHYMELFDASTVGAQITDKEYHVLRSSRAAKDMDTKVLCQTARGPVMLNDGIRLSGAPIRVGYVVWTEDISPLLKVLDELEEVKENLEDSNTILEEEHALKKREAHIMEQDRLYTIIQRDTAHQIRLLDHMIEQVETVTRDEERKQLLRKMLVIGAYLKRRSNLVFLADKSSTLDAKELALTLGESLDNLETCGISCGFQMDLKEPVLSDQMIAMYDFFEKVVERSLDCTYSITVYAGKTDDFLFLRVNTDADTDFSDLASDMVKTERDEDEEWRLTLRLSIGGGDQ
ncbi:MAG: hypothetical protein SPK58_07820 [Lachnospiraceae bacterium]|nr:hypothetical protein [Lachnospiraceae bacterium]